MYESRKLIFGAMTIVAVLLLWQQGSADVIDDLKSEIEQKNAEIQKLNEEAEKYRAEVEAKQQEAQTLKAEISRVNNSIGKLQRDIAITERTVERTELEIKTLTLEILEKERAINKLRRGLAGLIQVLFEQSERPLFVSLVGNRFLSDFFTQLDYVAMLEDRILGSLDNLRVLKSDRESKKTAAEKKQQELASLKNSLGGKKAVQESIRNERNNLLSVTRNEEKRYQTLLKEQEEKRAKLEDEIQAIEDTIRITVDPSSLPPKRAGILEAPLPELSVASCWQMGSADSKNCVTQFFGYTSFARAGGYGAKKGHNGVDFRAPIGTPVLAAENGTVSAAGDTDLGCRGASYGKWILIAHPNGLSTLYTHLSNISVAAGQDVLRGSTIGHSGKTGYATGPHLHFTVFATQAVQIESIRSKVCGRLMTLPIAPVNGYLDPLDYL